MKQKKLFFLLMPVLIAAQILSCQQQDQKNETVETLNTVGEAASQQQQKPADTSVLSGNWIRTDGGYRIEVAEVFVDGRMKAFYFNPGSINVSKAVWNNNGGVLKIYIELKDLNYPGSNYNLTYIQQQDMLAGEYYQALEGTIYKVEFKRAK